VIGALSALNRAFIEIIVAARILYGLSADDGCPAISAMAHHARKRRWCRPRPWSSPCCCSLFVPIEALAETTALITLAVFAGQSRLLRIKRRATAAAGGLSRWVPLSGFCFRRVPAAWVINRLSG
jgi:hypothetical protein